MSERADASAAIGAEVIRGGGQVEQAKAVGIYVAECIGPDGQVKWREEFPNVVTTVGKNLMLDTALAGSAYTVTGPYLGLISSVSWSAVNAADTMASHAGWTEAGTGNAPQWTTPAAGARASVNGDFAAASGGSKQLTAAESFSISTSGTLKGAFLVFGSGAVATNGNTSGTLLSAGTFTGGDKTVGNGDTVNVSWSISL